MDDHDRLIGMETDVRWIREKLAKLFEKMDKAQEAASESRRAIHQRIDDVSRTAVATAAKVAIIVALVVGAGASLVAWALTQ